MIEITEEELQAKLIVWQKRLGLCSWRLVLTFQDNREVNYGQAATSIHSNSEAAYIKLTRSGDRQESDLDDHDMELDLVHELIHIRLWSIDPKDLDNKETLNVCREQAIDWIARALVSADRESK